MFVPAADYFCTTLADLSCSLKGQLNDNDETFDSFQVYTTKIETQLKSGVIRYSYSLHLRSCTDRTGNTQQKHETNQSH